MAIYLYPRDNRGFDLARRLLQDYGWQEEFKAFRSPDKKSYCDFNNTDSFVQLFIYPMDVLVLI